MLQDIETIFEQAGGTFLRPASALAGQLEGIHAFLFDWDGVFNSGSKTETQGSPFTETDSMGTNLLRFGHWLKHGKLPVIAIITGQNNPAAVQFAKRECFDAVYSGFKNKQEALGHLLNNFELKSRQVAFTFDDVLDLSVAEVAGLRYMVRTQAAPLLRRYATANNLCDYLTGGAGGAFAVREICELSLGLYGNDSEVITHRMRFSDTYQQYFAQRQSTRTRLYKHAEGKIEVVE